MRGLAGDTPDATADIEMERHDTFQPRLLLLYANILAGERGSPYLYWYHGQGREARGYSGGYTYSLI